MASPKWMRFQDQSVSFQEQNTNDAASQFSQSSKSTCQSEQDFMRSLLAQNRAALQQVLAEISERILETSMQQMISFQNKVTERQGELFAQQVKQEQGLLPAQMIGAKANGKSQAAGKWGKSKWKKNRSYEKSEEESPVMALQPIVVKEVQEDEETHVGAIEGAIEVAEQIWAGITGVRKAQGFAPDAENMKARLRAELSQPLYDVTNFYKTSGVWQAIARSAIFENLTLCVIAFNAIWIAVDVDLNDATALHEADTIFVIMDNFFCCYFLVEITIRFRAFADKRNCLKDVWFVFDSFMATLMIIETWILTLIFLVFSIEVSSGGDDGKKANTSVLKIFRFFRLVRLARVMHVCRALPELMVVIKGMAIATRAVSCTVALMLLVVYVFAVLFRQLTDGSTLGRKYFESVPIAMRMLLLHGTTPDLADTAVAIWDEGIFYALLFLIFILVVTITIMNMLVGVLVGVVQTVSAVEKETAMVAFMKNNLLTILTKMQEQDEDRNGLMSRDEFMVLLESKDALRAFDHIGVDVIGLLDLADFIFRDGKELPYQDFMELVMQLRGSNQATVKDIVDLRKFIALELDQIDKAENMILAHLTSVAGDKSLKPTDFTDAKSPTMAGLKKIPSFSLGAATEGLPLYLKRRERKDELEERKLSVAGAQTDSFANYKKKQGNGGGKKPFKRPLRQSLQPPSPRDRAGTS